MAEVDMKQRHCYDEEAFDYPKECIHSFVESIALIDEMKE